MHARFDQLEFATEDAPSLRRAAPASGIAPVEWQPGGGYGRRPLRPGAIAAILLVHAGLLAALVKLDVITVHKKTVQPLVVTLVPEPVAPPPAPPAEKLEPIAPVKPRIVAPAPVVVLPQPAPVEIATVREPPPPQAVVAVAAPTAPPAPVTPPDASAASLKNPAPHYPIESRRKREEGVVRLRVVITVDGRVKTISVARSSGFERLDEAALDTVAKWKFRPGMQAGAAVEAIGFLVIPFKIAA